MDIEEYIEAKLPCIRPSEELLSPLPALARKDKAFKTPRKKKKTRRYSSSKGTRSAQVR
jgi:hypothetical protein